MTGAISVVVPARNEADTISRVVDRLGAMPWVDEIVVVDNASRDGTAAAAEKAGARGVYEPQPGMGHAVRAGLAAARNDWVMKVDADLDRFDTSRFAQMVAAREDGVGLVKGAWHDPADNMPMTRLLVMPALQRLYPGLSHLTAPNSGIYVVDRSLFAHQEIVGSYAADIDIMLRVYASGARVTEVDIGRISHDIRDVGHYNAMAEVIMGFFLDRQAREITEELVVMAEDAAQVVNHGLGILAARSRAGGLVSVYLAQPTGPAADILRDALEAFPGARVLPLDLSALFRARGPEGRVRFVAPYPVADRNHAICAALAAQARIAATSSTATELLLMPQDGSSPVAKNFQPDFAFDIRAGSEIKRAALDRLALPVAEAGRPVSGPREMFQTYESLPEPLKLSLPSQPQAGAGRM